MKKELKSFLVMMSLFLVVVLIGKGIERNILSTNWERVGVWFMYFMLALGGYYFIEQEVSRYKKRKRSKN